MVILLTACFFCGIIDVLWKTGKEVEYMQPITNVKIMRSSDAGTIQGGVSGRELMRRAAKGIFESYAWQGKTAVVCGSGNNAGDGYALALLLHAAKIPCTVWLLCDRFSPDGAYYYEKCREIGVEIRPFTEDVTFVGYAEIVDCIFGTGFYGEATGLAKTAIERINQSGAFVVSADINSGLCGDNGLGKTCVRSNLTVSIGFYQYGHVLNQAKDMIGKLINIDIGIHPIGGVRYLAEARDFANVLPQRLQDSHKGAYGYVSILGGCTAYAGAVKLANLSCAALRAGCGVAQLIVPASLAPAVAPYLLESTLALLPERNGHAVYDPAALDRVLSRQAALAIGMGWGSSPENAPILAHILAHYAFPLVIDADGLNTLAGMDLELLKATKCRVLLTPHLKEMERLSGIPIDEIRRDPVGVAETFAQKYRVLVLLKGPATVVTDGKTTYLVNRGCAGMATAGSGDVLSGILVGLLGYAPPTALTVACGAYIAGLAGELAERDLNPVSMLASDTVSHIGAAVSELLNTGE